MSRATPHLLLLLGAALVVGGCSDDPPAWLSASPTVLDFGSVLHGDEVTRSVDLHNGASHPVAITRAYGNCACFHVPAFGQMIQPGETRRIDIVFRSALVPPERLRGKALTILSNDQVQPKIEIDLTGEAVRPFVLTPESVEFGSLADGVEPQTIRLRPGPGLRVELLTSHASPREVLALEARDVESGADLILSLRTGASGAGSLRGAVELRIRVSGAGFGTRNLQQTVRVQGEWPEE